LKRRGWREGGEDGREGGRRRRSVYKERRTIRRLIS